MALDNSKQRVMPSPDDRLPDRCQQLCYPEAVLLLNPENPILTGEVDDKYQYSRENKISMPHGWISQESAIGFWVLTPSFEFRNGGITKQNLTSHVGPTSLSVFHSGHYVGTSLYAQFRNGEAWRKVFGPVRIYLNTSQENDLEVDLWEDAKRQNIAETQAWPYHWPSSNEYLKDEERGTIKGRLQVEDRFAYKTVFPAAGAKLGLAAPGEAGSWQLDSKGYQFWTEADKDGNFIITNIIPGEYCLYGWVPNVLGEYKKDGLISMKSGVLEIGELIYQPPRHGQTVWEIGTPDRTAEGFFIPDPNPIYVNKLFINHPERYRQYGLWLQYSESYPDDDLVFYIGKSDPTRDWFFAHVCRIKDGSLLPTTWKIMFQLDNILENGNYKLQIALASANLATLQVRVNDESTTSTPLFEVEELGFDNAIARHGIHGVYHLLSVDITWKLLKIGQNCIYLTQANTKNCLVGLMYDYLRLEEPAESLH
ncbi:hypothetical protein KP509_14G009000 [Ceratopteris richardii]|uniref:Rhamnogalacturonan endolyase n=1 Tax=Ceratopteris richardii TaxID=49495 RepID=A0A8T2TAI9_CERRI|nr:hypothetical protein KP509_14G009000 [Ceratopteris richardii]